MIKIYQKSINKSGHKNGDFIYASNIMDTRAVGVLGDFTSDSNAGDSEICCETVKQFINANLSNWCHNLVEGSEIVEQLANNVNKWLADNTSGSRTTLIVILYDSHKKKLYYIVQGDSGLAIVKKEQIKYINKGDTSALKIATGFLPVQSKFNTEIIVNVEPTDFIFAYTDGFWKNTKLHRNGGENKIIEILRKERWEQTEVSINENIFDTSPRKDDMTILVMKEDVMDKPPLTGLNPKTNSKKTKNLHNTPYQVLDYLKSELNIIREEIEVTNRKSPLEEFLIHQLDKLSVAKSQEDFGILEQIQTEITDTRGKIEERLSILLKQAEQFEKLDKAISDLKKLIEQLTEQVTQQPQIDPNKADAHYEELKKLIEKLTEQPQ
ncbi:MAG: SpoIIE family protein phosphatase, partial [Desulfobacterales bacterium]|nr:SpoIIE family protein phosphatase [Desulfobacterales bacterium]